VRNRRTGLRWLTAAIGVAVSCSAAAQGVTSAQGAQQYLADLARNTLIQVYFVDGSGRSNYVTGKYTGDVKTIKGGLRKTKETIEALPEKDVDKQLADVRVSVLEAIDAWGRPSACTTRITEVTAPSYDDVKSDVANDTGSFSWTQTYTNESWKYEPLTKFMNPAQVIDWSDARVSRGIDGSVTAISRGQGFRSIHLTYVTRDAGAADRVEYAMKFLMMSCGDNLSAGS
jgi:hypothetical protein